MSHALALQAGSVRVLSAAAMRLTTSTAGWLLNRAGLDSGQTASQVGWNCDQTSLLAPDCPSPSCRFLAR